MWKRVALLCGLVLLVRTDTSAKEALDPNHVVCSGVLTINDGYYQLNPDVGSGPWCDSSITGKLVKRVLKACGVGRRCHIEGSVIGHGEFSWFRIRSVTNVIELPSEYFGSWGSDGCHKGDLSNGGFEVTATTIRYNYALCRVVSDTSTHPGWHTESIVLACNNGAGRSSEIWHVQHLDGRDFLATVQLTREGPERGDGPSMGIWRKCD